MKILNTDSFITERVKVKPVTIAELDKARKQLQFIPMVNPTYDDICQEGNVVFVYDGDNTRSYVVMYNKEHSYISLTGFSAHLNNRFGSIRHRTYWDAEQFKDDFPYYKLNM